MLDHGLTKSEFFSSLRQCSFLILLVVTVTLFLCGVLGCGGEKATDKPSAASAATLSPEGERLARAEAERRAADAERAAADAHAAAMIAVGKAMEAENALKLGKEGAKSTLVETSSWVGRVSALNGFLCVAGLVVSILRGNAALLRWIAGLGVSVAGVFIRFFIVMYGYQLGIALCWVGLAIVAALVLFSGALGARWLYGVWNARTLARKRAAAGEDAKDAIALWPASRPAKAILHDAYTTLLTAPSGDPAATLASRVLARARFPEPAIVPTRT